MEHVNTNPLEGVSLNKIYRHFKGGYYLVMNLASSSDDCTDLVVYRSLKTGEVWTRTLQEFLEPVPEGKENPTGQLMRFEEVTDFENQISLISTDALVEELHKRNDNPYVGIAPRDVLNNIWTDEYVTGRIVNRFIDKDHTNEEFQLHSIHSTLEGALDMVKKGALPDLVVLRRMYYIQDLDKLL